MPSACYSATKAAKFLGISIPTLKEMCASGEIAHFYTPGGHLRIPAEFLVSFRGRTPGVIAVDGGESPLLDSRIDDLNRESQEQGGQEGTHGQTHALSQAVISPTAKARGQELQQWKQPQEVTMEWEAEQLQVAQKSQRPEEVREREQDFVEARSRLGVFRQRWRSAISDLLPSWLSFEQHEQAHAALDGVIARCSERDEEQMPWVLRDAIARLVAPWEKERQTLIRREQVLQGALWSLSLSASAEEKAKVTTAIRTVLADLSLTALNHEERTLADEAIRRMNEQVKVRLAAEEKERLQKLVQAQKVREEQQLKSKKDSLLRQGVDKVFWCLQRLMNDDEISEEDYEDIDQKSLKRAVGKSLQSEITGDESYQDLEALVVEIVREELEIG